MSRPDEIFIIESPISLTEGDQPAYTIIFSGATTLSGATVEIFKNGSGSNIATSLSMTVGSFAYGVGSLDTPVFRNFVGGNKYVATITVTVDNIVEVRKIQFDVQKAKSLQ